MLKRPSKQAQTAQADAVSLNVITPPANLPVEEDTRAAEFKADLAEQQARHLQEENEDLKSTRQLRKSAALHAFCYLCGLSVAVFVLLLFHGFRLWGFQLDTVVLTTLSGGTFVSAIGLFGIVVKGLFPNRSNGPAKNRKRKDRTAESH